MQKLKEIPRDTPKHNKLRHLLLIDAELLAAYSFGDLPNKKIKEIDDLAEFDPTIAQYLNDAIASIMENSYTKDEFVELMQQSKNRATNHLNSAIQDYTLQNKYTSQFVNNWSQS